MRFVELKTIDELDMQTLDRSRERLVSERTAPINQLRAVLLVRGSAVPQDALDHHAAAVPGTLFPEDDTGVLRGRRSSEEGSHY